MCSQKPRSEKRGQVHTPDDVVVPEQVHVAGGLAADRRGRAADGEAVDADGLDVALAALVDVVAGDRAQRLLAQDLVGYAVCAAPARSSTMLNRRLYRNCLKPHP